MSKFFSVEKLIIAAVVIMIVGVAAEYYVRKDDTCLEYGMAVTGNRDTGISSRRTCLLWASEAAKIQAAKKALGEN